jgi:hypothetical protein
MHRLEIGKRFAYKGKVRIACSAHGPKAFEMAPLYVQDQLQAENGRTGDAGKCAIFLLAINSLLSGGRNSQMFFGSSYEIVRVQHDTHLSSIENCRT